MDSAVSTLQKLLRDSVRSRKATGSPPKLPARKRSPGDPRVSVVMPTYNRADSIGGSIRTLLEGSYADFELLVQDDSIRPEETERAITEAIAGDPRVSYVQNETRQKMPGNLNAAIARSRGEFVAVCHDHDHYYPRFLADMVEVLDRNPSALFVHCGNELVTKNGVRLRHVNSSWSELTDGKTWQRYMLSSFNCPVCALAMVRRSAHEHFGLYDPRFGFVADVEMWFRLSGVGDVAYARGPLVETEAREEDHFANRVPLKLTRIVADIHREYASSVAKDRIEEVQLRARLEARLAYAAARLGATSRLRTVVERARQVF